MNLNKSTLSESPTLNNKVSKVAAGDKVSIVTPITKVSPATPKVAKLSRGVAKSDNGSPSPLQSSRVSFDRSPGSAPSKPVLDRRSPKLSTTPDVRITFLFFALSVAVAYKFCPLYIVICYVRQSPCDYHWNVV